MAKMKPALPESHSWPARTRDWWQTLVTSPTTDGYTPLQWEYAIDTALVHAAVWGGDMTRAPELRTRTERLGALPAAGKAKAPAPARTGKKAVNPLDEVAQRRAKRKAGS